MHRIVILSALTITITLTGPAAATQPDMQGIKKIFTDIDAALKAGDATAFKARWHAKGFDENLVGPSGLAGKKVLEQGHRKGWFLRPDPKTLGGPGRAEPWIIQCAVVRRKDDKAVDAVWAVFADGKVFGAGEKKDEAMALARRVLNKKPLAPPAK